MLVSRINTEVYSESVLESFDSFTLKIYVSEKYDVFI